MKNILTLIILFISVPVMATDTLDCGNDDYHFALHIGHDDKGDLVADYMLYYDEKLIVQSNDYLSKISWVENELESNQNTLSLIDVKNEIEIKFTKNEQFFTFKGKKYLMTCDWVR